MVRGERSMANAALAGPLTGAFVAPSPYDQLVRACDIVLSFAALLFFLPLMVVIAVTVMVTSGQGPVIFAQRRIGKGGVPFYCLKFRSMENNAEEKLQALLATCPESRAAWDRDQKLSNDPRITPIGRILRKTSLDELPQFWNVLVGDMSIVGPRPIIDSERGRYGRYFRFYTMVKPGITGLWQISGRNSVSYRRRVAMDVAFAKSQSFKLYCKIFFMTVPAVLLAHGSS